jgi:hypothetical protein
MIIAFPKDNGYCAKCLNEYETRTAGEMGYTRTQRCSTCNGEKCVDILECRKHQIDPEMIGEKQYWEVRRGEDWETGKMMIQFQCPACKAKTTRALDDKESRPDNCPSCRLRLY